MKKVSILQDETLDIKPFVLDEFISKESTSYVSKKEIKELASMLGLDYNAESISFAKKILNAYLDKKL